jgi:hypothetical protein
MINKIDKERRHSMNAAPTRPNNKRQRQGAKEDPKEKQDRAKPRKMSSFTVSKILYLNSNYNHNMPMRRGCLYGLRLHRLTLHDHKRQLNGYE